MDIKTLKLSDIKPYNKNPRKNNAAVDKVAESIKEFGFKQPIVVDRDNVIVAGHTRYKAAKKLGLKEVLCLIASDLTDDQVKAYRLADNKTAEAATWDSVLLKDELLDLNLDMEIFGFDLDDIFKEKAPDYKQTKNLDNLFKSNFNAENDWGIPEVQPFTDDLSGIEWVSFGEKSKVKNFSNIGIHFYIDDYKFESVWTSPDKYIEMFQKCLAVVTPDFSNYTDMPIAQQIWNQYRRQWCGRYWQDRGVNVICSLSWAQGQICDWSFAGIPHSSTVATSFVGNAIDDKQAFEEFESIIGILKPYKTFVKTSDFITFAGYDIIPPYKFKG